MTIPCDIHACGRGPEPRLEVGLPKFVEREVEDYVTCGILECGSFPTNRRTNHGSIESLGHGSFDVFAIDVTVCPQCDGAMRWIEAATSPDEIARVLASAGFSRLEHH